MISHQMATRVSPEPPVRFYKTIAITFLILTVVLLGVIVFFTSKKTTVVVVAKSDNKNVNLLLGVNENGDNSGIPGTVIGVPYYWEQKYYPTEDTAMDGIATGEVIIYNDSLADQVLIKTTRLLNKDGALFRLSDRVGIPANGKATASVYADKEGASGDVGPGDWTIPGLSKAQQKLVYAKSVSKMSGGVRKVGVLTEEDMNAAKEDYREKVKEAFLQNYKENESDKRYSQKAVDVEVGDIKVNASVGDEISEYVISGTSTIAVVYYDSDALRKLINDEIYKEIDGDSEKVLSFGPSSQVSLESYDLDSKEARLSVYQDILVTLDADVAKLDVSNFFGKRKDEIERYVTGLEHVVGTDIQFSPSWIKTAPTSKEKVKVIVKNVK